MKVLSLFDGISCGMVALERAGIQVERYVAYEIEQNAIKISKKNYPQIEHCGDVTKADFTQYQGFDLLMGGSPCQSLSIVRSKDRQHLKGKSRLFYEFVRAFEVVKPKYFLFENVASMNEESKQAISELLGCQPVFIDSADFSPQQRERLYWTNIPITNITFSNNQVLQDILEKNVEEKFFYNLPLTDIDMSKRICAMLEPWNYAMMKRVYNPQFKAPTLTCVTGGNQQKKVLQNGRARKLTPLEYERLQTLPDGYTEGIADTARYTAIGNGWTVDVIAHILSYIKNEKEKEMELKVKTPTFPEVIEFNFEELKQEITERASTYVNLVYSEEQIKDAKNDRAALNKFVKALSDERIKIKKECLKPYEDFEAKIKELDKIVSAAIGNIDSQVKGYEEKKKQEKLDEITNFFNSTNHPEWLHIAQIMSDKWLNASVTMKAVMGEIDARLEQITNDIATLANLPEFGFEATEVYKTTLDMNKALNEGSRLAEIQKRKAEHERLQAEMAEQQARLAAEVQKEVIEPAKEAFAEDAMNPPEVPAKHWVSFRAKLTVEQARELKQFFDDRKIEFEAI